MALIGLRQVGKTTLAKDLADSRPSSYLDLENIADRGKLENPDIFLGLHEDELVVLDNIHQVPEIDVFGKTHVVMRRERECSDDHRINLEH